MNRQAVQTIAETIQNSNDLVQAANRIAQKYGRDDAPPEIVLDVLDGLIQMQAESKGQPIDDNVYRNLVDRHIPAVGNLHDAMFGLRANAEQRGTQVFPAGKQIRTDTKVFDPDARAQGGDTEVYDPDTDDAGTDTEVYQN